MDLLACQRCGSRAVYSKDVKAYVCSRCHNYVGTMIRCPGCEHIFRVSESIRPLNFSCPDCGRGLGLTRENKMVGDPRSSPQIPVYEVSCQSCGRGGEIYWWYCPGCGEGLKDLSEFNSSNSCPSCKLLVEEDWDFCAFCSEDLNNPSTLREEAPAVQESPAVEEAPAVEYPSEAQETESYSPEPQTFTPVPERHYPEREYTPPDYTPSISSRQDSEREAGMEKCPNCRKPVEEEWLTCQYCMARLKAKTDTISCPRCGEEVEASRMMCPRCYTDLSHNDKTPPQRQGHRTPMADSISRNYSREPKCPLCGSDTQYSEEADDNYCWVCQQYISSMKVW